jgi:hypothetical protein
MTWARREIENYLCLPTVLKAYARADQLDDLFGRTEADRREQVMDRILQDLVPPVALRDSSDPWWAEEKASDQFLDRLFERYFRELGLPSLMRKGDYHQLASLVKPEQIPQEVTDKLDTILREAGKAKAAPQ